MSDRFVPAANANALEASGTLSLALEQLSNCVQEGLRTETQVLMVEFDECLHTIFRTHELHMAQGPRIAFVDLSMHPQQAALLRIDSVVRSWSDLAGMSHSMEGRNLRVVMLTGLTRIYHYTPARFHRFVCAQVTAGCMVVLVEPAIPTALRLSLHDEGLRLMSDTIQVECQDRQQDSAQAVQALIDRIKLRGQSCDDRGQSCDDKSTGSKGTPS
jgi:hypothetical protein